MTSNKNKLEFQTLKNIISIMSITLYPQKDFNIHIKISLKSNQKDILAFQINLLKQEMDL